MKILTQAFGALALFALIAAPAATAAAAPQSPETAVEADLALDFENDPLQVQGPPADLPNEGFACELPPQQVNENCICPLVFDPVCGCNGETYSNACFASCEVRTFSEGAC